MAIFESTASGRRNGLNEEVNYMTLQHEFCYIVHESIDDEQGAKEKQS